MENQITETVDEEGKQSQTERRRKWEVEVAAFLKSEQSLATYCRERNMKPWQLRYWLKALSGSEAKGGFEELPASPRSKGRRALLSGSAPGGELRLESNGWLIHVPDGVNAKQLGVVLAAVRVS